MVRGQLRENLDDVLSIQLFGDSAFTVQSFLGEVAVQWKGCLDEPNTWRINSEYKLENITYSEQAIQVNGNVGI